MENAILLALYSAFLCVILQSTTGTPHASAHRLSQGSRSSCQHNPGQVVLTSLEQGVAAPGLLGAKARGCLSFST